MTYKITGILALALGLSYLLGFYGPLESEIRLWAMLCTLAGVLVLVGAKIGFRSAWKKVAGMLGFSLLLAAQVPAIYMWFTSPMISDKNPADVFVLFSIPHFLLAALCLICLFKVSKK
jgi:hypothetical protein